MRDHHFRTMILLWLYMIRSMTNQNTRIRQMTQLPYLLSLQIWLKIQTGVFTHCVVEGTNMPLTLEKVVIGINTVLMLSSKLTTVEVHRERHPKQARQTQLVRRRNEATVDTKGSPTSKFNRMSKKDSSTMMEGLRPNKQGVFASPAIRHTLTFF